MADSRFVLLSKVVDLFSGKYVLCEEKREKRRFGREGMDFWNSRTLHGFWRWLGDAKFLGAGGMWMDRGTLVNMGIDNLDL